MSGEVKQHTRGCSSRKGAGNPCDCADEKHIQAGGYDGTAYCIYPSSLPQPYRSAVKLLDALRAVLYRDEATTCQHESTHRGGSIWEICDECGAKWADDEGGKPAWTDPPEWVKARTAITEAESSE
jgi:hypothetical protein